jgi:hypothetical protein
VEARVATSSSSNRQNKKKIQLAALGLVAAVLYLFIVAQVGRYLVEHPGAPGGVWLAAAPIAVLLLVLVVAMRSLNGMDELERKMHTEAMAFAFLASLFIVTSCGALAQVGILRFSLAWITPTMVLSWVVGLAVLDRRYRAG